MVEDGRRCGLVAVAEEGGALVEDWTAKFFVQKNNNVRDCM